MFQYRIATIIATAVVLVLSAGCAAQSTGAGSPSLSDVAAAPSTTASELSGTWRGWFFIAGGEADRRGDLALEVKDDATYRLTWTRRGATSVESGVVVANGRRVSLTSSSGHVVTLVRDGDTLYGMSIYLGGHPVQVSVKRATGTASGPDSEASASPTFGPKAGDSRSAPAPDPLQAP